MLPFTHGACLWERAGNVCGGKAHRPLVGGETRKGQQCGHLLQHVPGPDTARRPVQCRAVQVRALFALAGLLSPSVIFIDEIDSLISARKSEGADPAHVSLSHAPPGSLCICAPATTYLPTLCDSVCSELNPALN